MGDDERLREHPRERLAGPTQLIDLAEAAAALAAEPHGATEGHRQIAVVRRGPVTVILFVFEPGGVMPEHRAPGDVLLHVLSGRLEVTLADEVVTLVGGQVLAIAPDLPHAVRALARTDMLLTVCRVAGAKR
jgi:quercetin dioxygenase-like cupin family protein